MTSEGSGNTLNSCPKDNEVGDGDQQNGFIPQENPSMTVAEAQALFDESKGEVIPKSFHYCSTHHCIEADFTCPDATANSEDDCVPSRLLWVGLYEINKAYGGREEGGWYYDCGVLVTDGSIYSEIGVKPSVHTHFSEARAAMKAMDAAAAPLNEGRPDISSVCCDGVYSAEIHEGHLVPHYPATRPHYE